jgi:outer membrane immunogenic protein
MRWVICALVALVLPHGAYAADLDVLRGSQTVGPAYFTNWSGFYIGGQIGFSDANADFSKSTQAPIADELRNTTLENISDPSQVPMLGAADHTGMSYGGYIGYNSQWQSAMIGIEANYTHTSLSLNAPNSPIGRSGFSAGPGDTYAIVFSGSGTLTSLAYGSLRARAGWIFDNFMPYGFAGLTVGMANINVATNLEFFENSFAPFTLTTNSGQSSELLYGFVAGGGLDVAVTRNVFLRAEYEYTRFLPASGVVVSIAGAHFGAGIKF